MTVIQEHIKKNRSERIRERIHQDIPEISTERARLIAESYKKNEADHILIKSAKALYDILTKVTISIFNDELVVGSQTELSRGAPLFPEYTWEWIFEELESFHTRPIDKFFISEKNKDELRKILKNWQGKTVTEKIDAAMHRFQDINDSLEAGILICRRGRSGTGHIIPHYEKVIRKGFKGVIAEVEEQLAHLDYTNPEDEKRLFTLEAMKIVCDAAIKYASRYSDEARRLAENETNTARREELQKIAAVCSWVPANPARTFWEALQSLWFAHLIIQIESHGHSISLGRLDMHLYPFFKQDLEEGRITREMAQELIECLWLKFNEIVKVRPRDHAKVHAGYPVYQGITLGGQDIREKDATNEISHMCLEATARVQLPQPTLMIRVNANTPIDFLTKAHEVSTLGLGIPIYTNDDTAISAMLTRGIPLEDARNYGLVGCWEIQPEGKSETAPYGGYINMAKCLEIVLYNGRDPRTGKTINETSPEIKTYKDLMGAFEAQVKKAVRQLVIINNMGDYLLRDIAPLPFLSCLVEDCIVKGKTLIEGGARYNFTSLHGPGLATVADSLAAMKRLVFEEKLLNLKELREMLANDFAGEETLRQVLINKAPKYGNDDDYVDEIAKHVVDIFCHEVEKYPNTRGGKCWPGLWGSENSIPMGFVVGATPDGRKAHMPLSDGCSPSQGRDIKGPTAVVKSVAKIDHILGGADGTQLNMKFAPSIFNNKNGLGNLITLTKTFFDLNGESICYFVMSSEVLKEAQKNPEQYKNLVVRVAGYSAFFTELSGEIQDDLIARMEHKTGM
jgi:formate C-acetyltransferase